jgi:hypothetical protein
MIRGLVALLAVACTVTEECPALGTWTVDFAPAAACGVPNAAAFEALKRTCTPLSVVKSECTQDAEFLCANGVRVVQSFDTAAGYGHALIEAADCSAYVEGEIK